MKFNSEAHLCERFEDWVIREGGEIDREPRDGKATWDLLVTRERGGGELEQVGVHAKDAFGAEVLLQAIRDMRRPQGPDIGAILVPKITNDFAKVVVEGIGLAVITPSREWWDEERGELRYDFDVVEPGPLARHPSPPQRMERPRFANETPAGVPSPRVMTKQKERELRLCMILRRKGYVNSKDFRSVGMNPKFVPGSWLYRSGYNKFTQVEGSTLPDEYHPKATAALARETA